MKGKERIKRVFYKITILQRIKNIWQRIKKFFLERFLVFAEVMSIVFFIVIFASLIVRGFCDDSSYFFDKLMGTDGESNAKYQTFGHWHCYWQVWWDCWDYLFQIGEQKLWKNKRRRKLRQWMNSLRQ